MKKIFISYSRQDQDHVQILAGELKARGLRLWRDVDNLPLGTLTQDEIRNTLAQECQGCLVYLTPNSLSSAFVMKVELKEAVDHLNRDKNFALIPILHGISLNQAKAAVPIYAGRSITDLNGILIPATATPEEIRKKFAEAAQRLLETILGNNAAAFLSDPAKKVILDFHTRQYTPNIPEADVDLDWRSFLQADDTFAAATCAQILWPALNAVKIAVAQTLGPRTVLIRPSAHLSCGVALGFAFRSTTGFQFEIKQGAQIWSTNPTQKVSSPLLATPIGGDLQSDEGAIELSVSQSVTDKVDLLVQQRGRNFCGRVVLKPPVGNRYDIASSDEANAIAQQVADAIDSIRHTYPQLRSVHLFMAAPLALAILIGYRLNARGVIHLYELSKTTHNYSPSFSIV